jgi:membrane protein
MGDVTEPGHTRLLRLATWPLRVLRRLVAVLPVAIDGYFAHRLTQHAAGIAYRVLFSLVPLTIILVSIFGLVLQDDELRADVIDEIVGWLPITDTGRQDVENAITDIATPASALGLLSLLVFAWAATGMMAAIRNGLETAMDVRRSRPAVRGKLVDFVLVAAAGVLVLVAVGANLAIQVANRVATNVADAVGLDWDGFGWLVGTAAPVALSTVVVMLLYRFVPARGLQFREAVAGAIVTGLLFLAISLASAFLYEKAARLSFVYGSITAVLVFLYAVFLFAAALLLGAEVASAWGRPQDGPGEPVLVQIRRAAVGLFVHRDPAPEPDRARAYQADEPAGSASERGRTT